MKRFVIRCKKCGYEATMKVDEYTHYNNEETYVGSDYELILKCDYCNLEERINVADL